MEKLLRELYEAHGPIHVYPKRTTSAGAYEESYDIDLDQSFEFLLKHHEGIPEICLNDESLAMSYLSGFFDAEGSILLHRKQYGYGFEVTLTNTNLALLESIGRILELRGIHISISKSGKVGAGGGIDTKLQVWRLVVWRRDDVVALLRVLSLRHPERKAKAELALSASVKPHPLPEDVLGMWRRLTQRIKDETHTYVTSAQLEYERRRTPRE
jgi:intein-encoded DNA endonuclease-like protein